MMNPSKRVVLDTSVIVGLIDSRDVWHCAAIVFRDALKVVRAETVYFDCIVNETISVLARRAKERKRHSEFADLLARLTSQVSEEFITWISTETKRFYPEVIALISDSSGILNFHDALIALGCREMGIKFIATFDSDFDRVMWLKRLSTPDDAIERLE